MLLMQEAWTYCQKLSSHREFPKRFQSVKKGVRSLAVDTQAPTPLIVFNRFEGLSDEEGDSASDPAVESSDATPKAHISSVAMGAEHDLLCVTGKVNGRKATMLIDSGSTHDFLSSEFVRRHNLKTDTATKELKVTLADGSSRTQPLETAGPVKVVVADFSETQTFTVLPLARYDAILGMPWLSRHNPTIDFRSKKVQIQEDTFGARGHEAGEDAEFAESHFISAAQANATIRSGDEAYIAWVSTEDDAPGQDPPPIRDKEGTHFGSELKALLREFDDLFPDELPDQLPPERTVDHEIKVAEGTAPPSRPAYRLPKPELDELQKQIEELLRRGFLEPSKSPYGAPVFFVKKSDGSLRMVCDWRELNRITIKNKACLPHIEDLFDTVQGSAYFSKLDLLAGYNQIRIQQEDVPKTAINTPFGHYQFRVMGFGLTNAPATFQSLMNSILQPYLRQFVVVFLDDILIFSKTLEEHVEHIRTVLTTLRANQLFCKLPKCEFAVEEILFLGHRLTGSSISPDPEKLAAVRDWPTPCTVKDVRQFLGFTNYFRRFIRHYSYISKPLEELTGKYTRFSWTGEAQAAFEELRRALLNPPILRLPDVSKPFRVETDASDFAIAGVLSQEGEPGCWLPVAYGSRKLSSAERNYTASERETLAVVSALRMWRIYLFEHFDVFTDNRAAVYLLTKSNLTKRESRWVEFLADFDYTIHHKPGKENVADPLSRRPDLRDEDHVVPPEARLNAIEYTLEVNDDIANMILDSYAVDPELSVVMERMKRPDSDNVHSQYFIDNDSGFLYLKASPSNRLCIPRCTLRLKLVQENHDCVTAGHPGRDRTYSRLAKFFYWPKMGLDVKRFVKSCDICQRTKPGRLRTGLLQSLPIPKGPWEDIAMDFITGLPRTAAGHDAIYTFVDRLTKCVHLVPTTTSIDAKGSAELYIANVFRLHGLSSSIVSDRDPRFTAAFFREVFQLLGTKLCFSTANHPQTDGLTERVNRLVEDILRAFINHKHDNWDKLLPLCEFSINSAHHSSTSHTPFYLNFGFHPRAPADLLGDRMGVGHSDWVKEQQDALRVAKDAIVAAQARQALYADNTRAPSTIKVRDRVLVYRDFLITPEARNQPTPKHFTVRVRLGQRPSFPHPQERHHPLGSRRRCSS